MRTGWKGGDFEIGVQGDPRQRLESLELLRLSSGVSTFR